MNRCLHITIHEGPAAAPRHATQVKDRRDSKGRTSTDPENDDPMPQVDDPGSYDLMTGPDALTADSVTPRADPSSGSFSSLRSAGCGEVVATACCCARTCQDTEAPAKTASHPFIGSRDYSGFVIVRMGPGIESGTAETLWELAQDHRPKLLGLQAVLMLPVKAKGNGRVPAAPPVRPPKGTLVSRPLVELRETVGEETSPLARAESLASILYMERQTAKTAFPPLHSLASYWRLDLREHPDLVEEVVTRLNSLAEVDLAYRELAATDPQEAVTGEDFSEDQGYLGDAPTGISAYWARRRVAERLLGMPSDTLTLCDLEQGWNLEHQDLKDLKDQKNQPLVGPFVGVNRAGNDGSPGHHGTAVLGQLAAAGRSTFGLERAAAELVRFVLASHYDENGSNGHVANAIFNAVGLEATTPQNQIGPLMRGDILLIEVQRGRLPAEIHDADFDAIRLASGLGVIVIEAAGNGGFDLDAYCDPSTGRSLRRGDPRFRDSGAILVGAARAGLPHDRAPFSNYGSRLDCFGRGEAVTTCGYGDLAGAGVTDFYTNRFSGTSSASAIIAGAAALLQILHQTPTGRRLEPRAMREILADPATGVRQGPNVHGNIGVMPDLKAIVRDRLQLVPNVYVRRSIGDDGAPPALEDEVSSSPDLLIPGENLTAPDGPVVPSGNIYLRLRNRGLGEGSVRAQLFASRAATLITPERWIPVNPSGLIIRGIPQGGTPFVAGPVSWAGGAGTVSDQPWSLLAILSDLEEDEGRMPPGQPYFDWAEYRAFLRGPGVAWRNIHHAPDPGPLSFYIAGTPDRARHFDFEMIQRLPAGAQVSITLPAALAAKLRQRLPWLDGGTGALFLPDEKVELFLPKRPRMAIRGVELAAGTYAGASFTVTGPLETGHSLALRQLWRGEEVGRLTWYFGPHPGP